MARISEKNSTGKNHGPASLNAILGTGNTFTTAKPVREAPKPEDVETDMERREREARIEAARRNRVVQSFGGDYDSAVKRQLDLEKVRGFGM